MNTEQTIAYVNAQVAAVTIEAQGMVAANQKSAIEGQHPLHCKPDFDALIEKYSLYHDSLLSLFHGL